MTTVDKVIRYYRFDLGIYTLVFQHMKLTLWLFLSAIIGCVILGSLAAIFTYYCLAIIIMVFAIASLCIFNTTAKKVVKEKYKLDSPAWHWRNDEFESMRLSELSKFLVKCKISSSTQMKDLATIVRNEAERCVTSRLFPTAIFAALFYPIWSEFVSYLYQVIARAEVAIIVFIGMSYVALVCSFTVGGLKDALLSLIDYRSQQMADLARILDSLALETQACDDK